MVTHGSHLHLRQHQAQLLDGARSTGAAVADEASRLVTPFCKQKINRVLERARSSMVVLRRNENVGIETADLGGPYFGVRLTVLAHYGRHGLVEKRQVEIFDVYEFELGVGTLLSDFVNPLSHGLAVATGPRASDDDCNSNHKFLLGDPTYCSP